MTESVTVSAYTSIQDYTTAAAVITSPAPARLEGRAAAPRRRMRLTGTAGGPHGPQDVQTPAVIDEGTPRGPWEAHRRHAAPPAAVRPPPRPSRGWGTRDQVRGAGYPQKFREN